MEGTRSICLANTIRLVAIYSLPGRPVSCQGRRRLVFHAKRAGNTGSLTPAGTVVKPVEGVIFKGVSLTAQLIIVPSRSPSRAISYLGKFRSFSIPHFLNGTVTFLNRMWSPRCDPRLR